MMEPTTAPQQAPTTPAPQGLPSLAPPAYALPTTPEAAAQEKQYVLQDPAFRARAMNPQSREWAHLLALGRAASGTAGPDDATAGNLPETSPSAETFKAPATPAEYELQMPQGLSVDDAEVDAWKAGMHAAGVDKDLAQLAWATTTGHASMGLTVEQADKAADTAERTLKGFWGVQYDENLAAANAEARRVFDALPATLKAGQDYRGFMASTGLGRSVLFIKALAERAQQRKPGGS